MKVHELVQFMLQEGNRSENRFLGYPDWPPDVFSVAATLVDRSNAYVDLLSIKS